MTLSRGICGSARPPLRGYFQQDGPNRSKPAPRRSAKDLMHAGGWFYPEASSKEAAMLDFHRIAMILLVLWITAATKTTHANAQEPAISEGERRGLAACLIKCPDGDMKCNNRCISQFQTRGAWSDRARACIRNCRNRYQGAAQQAANGILECSVNCVP